MKLKYKVSLLVIAIMLAASMTVGTSYAYWTTTDAQTNSNEVASGCLQIELNDTKLDESGNAISTSINLPNAYPISDAEGLETTPYTLTIKNVCSIKADYKILLNTLSSSTLNESNMKYHIVKTSPTITTMTPSLISSVAPVELDNAIANDLSNTLDGIIQKSYILGNGILNAQTENVTDSVTYDLRLWIDENATNEVMGSTFESAIAVYALATN